jgi:hypothetical protein
LTGAATAWSIWTLRREALRRSLHSYAKWISDAVGWGAVVYLLALLIAVVISGLDSIPRLDPPLPFAAMNVPVSILLAAYFAGGLLLPRRLTPVTVSRFDLMYLVLAPIAPIEVLRWPRLRNALAGSTVAVLVGLAWTVTANGMFATLPYLVIPASICLMVTVQGLEWLRYARGQRIVGPLTGRIWHLAVILLALLGLADPSLGLSAPFLRPAPIGAISWGVLAIGVTLTVGATLRVRYPPSFAHQNHVLGQLRYLTFSSLLTGSWFDPDHLIRLQRQLRSGRRKGSPPIRISPFPAAWGDTGLIAWRTLQQILRRSFREQVGLLLLMLLVTGLCAHPPSDPTGLVTASWAVGLLSARLLGPPLRPDHLPIRPLQRTAGRMLPGAVLAALVALSVLLPMAVIVTLLAQTLPLPAMPSPIAGLATAVTIPALGLTVLEKLSVTSRQTQHRLQIFVGAGFLALLPAVVLGAIFPPWAIAVVNLVGLLLLLRW